MDQHLVNRYGNTKPTWNSTQTWTNWFLRQRLDTPIQSVKAMRDRLPRIPFFPIPLSVSRFDYTVSRIHDHSFPPVPDKEILCDWLIPSNPSKTLILYFHGGIFV